MLLMAAAAAMMVTGCDEIAKVGGGGDLTIDTEDGKPLIELIEEYTAAQQEKAAQTESEDYYVIPETETDMGEGQAETAAGAAQTEAVQTEMQTEAAFEGPLAQIVPEVILPREAKGEIWEIGCEGLESGKTFAYRADESVQSASVVKLFIMGAVYQYMCYPESDEEMVNFGESYDGELRATIEKMITVSDNDAANLLIERLGKGDFAAGAAKIGEFCKKWGYTGTSIGRRFLDPHPTADNFISASDVTKFLSDVYHGTLVNEEASAKMLEVLKGQTRKNKIPAGLPEGYTSANKTGEMPEGYGLGCIENDAAIVFPPEGKGEPFVLTVLSSELGGRNSEAIAEISRIASMTAGWFAAQ